MKISFINLQISWLKVTLVYLRHLRHFDHQQIETIGPLNFLPLTNLQRFVSYQQLMSHRLHHDHLELGQMTRGPQLK